MRQPSSTTTARCVRATDARIVAASSGRSVRRSITSASMPPPASSSAAASALPSVPPYATSVTSAPCGGSRLGRCRWGRLVSQLALDVVQAAVLEDQHRVGIAQRGPQHAAGVLERGRGNDADAGNVGVPPFEAVRVLGSELATGTGGHADDERHVALPTGHVQQRGRVVDDLVEGEQAEVDRHDLDDRPHPADGRTDACTDECRLRQGCVTDSLGPELLEQPEAHGEAATVTADVLAHQEHPVIALERVAQRRRASPPGRCTS